MNNVEAIRNRWVEIYNKKFAEQSYSVDIIEFNTLQKELNLINEFIKDLDSIG